MICFNVCQYLGERGERSLEAHEARLCFVSGDAKAGKERDDRHMAEIPEDRFSRLKSILKIGGNLLCATKHKDGSEAAVRCNRGEEVPGNDEPGAESESAPYPLPKRRNEGTA